MAALVDEADFDGDDTFVNDLAEIEASMPR